METPPSKPAERLKSWPWGITLALLALLAIVAFVVWQLAFHYGSRQSNDLLLASPNASDEVIQLRAQLEEARSYQTTLLTVILASFAAGFTVLSVVNFAVLFIARRDYEHEEKRMREFLILEAEKRDAAEAKRADAEIAKFVRVISKRYDERIDQLAADQKNFTGKLTDLYGHVLSNYQSVASLDKRMAAEAESRRREEWQIAATEAEREGQYDRAAMYFSQVVKSEMGLEYGGVSPSNLSSITVNLDKIDQSKWISNSDLTFMLETLTEAQSLEGLPHAIAGELARGIEIIEEIIERQNQQISAIPEPPTMALRLPRTDIGN